MTGGRPPRSPEERLSRRLSYVLRHKPSAAGVELDPQGWVDVAVLLEGLSRTGHGTSRAQLEAVVARSPKQRFALDPTGQRIRAQQGHTVDVDLGLRPVEPPATLYHGTLAASVDGILREGLTPRGRHHVHLSADPETARAVGARRGRPVVLVVDARGMSRAGHLFFVSGNGVWLTDEVPPRYLQAPP